MKLLKDIARLLVLTSISLSLIPLTTAKAADAIQVQNSTAITYSANDTSADTTGDSTSTTSASKVADSKTSEVNVTVLSGYLTLEAVPDFNFGTMMQGTTAKLKNNTADVTGFDNATHPNSVGIDGNDTGLLEIIDSRNFSSTMPGFSLTATMGQLTTADGASSLPAILKLGSIPLLNSDNENISSSATDLKTNSTTIKSVNGSDAATTGTVIDLSKGSYNAGMVKANFNTPDSASLTIPGTSDNSKKSAKNMNSVITWTLSAKPNATN